jgi:glutaredoxin 2
MNKCKSCLDKSRKIRELKARISRTADIAGKVAAEQAMLVIHSRNLTSINTDEWRKAFQDLEVNVRENMKRNI